MTTEWCLSRKRLAQTISPIIYQSTPQVLYFICAENQVCLSSSSLILLAAES